MNRGVTLLPQLLELLPPEEDNEIAATGTIDGDAVLGFAVGLAMTEIVISHRRRSGPRNP